MDSSRTKDNSRLELEEDKQIIHLKGLLRQMKCQYADFTLANGNSYIYNGTALWQTKQKEGKPNE